MNITPLEVKRKLIKVFSVCHVDAWLARHPTEKKWTSVEEAVLEFLEYSNTIGSIEEQDE